MTDKSVAEWYVEEVIDGLKSGFLTIDDVNACPCPDCEELRKILKERGVLK